MPKKIKPNETHKVSFFSKLATLLAPIDEKILHTARTLPEDTTEKAGAPRPVKRRTMEIRPMQVIKI